MKTRISSRSSLFSVLATAPAASITQPTDAPLAHVSQVLQQFVLCEETPYRPEDCEENGQGRQAARAHVGVRLLRADLPRRAQEEAPQRERGLRRVL
uniref:Putative secreted protein n=1 Tax=Ixodes scapularis TaxID=6945 RepID=A0A4D5RVL0_IXOSC